jgi:hypothetical protein
MPCPSHPWLDHSNYSWQRVQVKKLLIMQFSPISWPLVPSKYSPEHPFSNTLILDCLIIHRNYLPSIQDFEEAFSCLACLTTRSRLPHVLTTFRAICLYILTKFSSYTLQLWRWS